MNKPTATFIKDVSQDFTGTACLYRLSQPLKGYVWDDDDEREVVAYEYVIASATTAMFSGAETYLFGADADGNILSWTELDGSFRGALDHERALREAGYELADTAYLAAEEDGG